MSHINRLNNITNISKELNNKLETLTDQSMSVPVREIDMLVYLFYELVLPLVPVEMKGAMKDVLRLKRRINYQKKKGKKDE
jgi:hypothetical protein